MVTRNPANHPVCRIGFVGTGGVAQRHAQVLAGFDDVDLVGVTDVDRAGRQAFAHGRTARRASRAASPLLATDLDAVYVCVPPFAHGPPRMAVIEAGVPMFVEKPLAIDLATAERIAARLARRGLLTARRPPLALPGRARPARRAARRPRRSGWSPAPGWTRCPPVPWWSRQDRSGGPVVEQATHVLDLVRVLVGEVTEVQRVGDGTPPPVDGADIDSVTTAALRFADGAVGTLSAACVLGWQAPRRPGDPRRRARPSASPRTGWRSATPTANARRRPTRRTPGVAVDRAFVDAVRGDRRRRPRVPYAEALRTHRLALAVAARPPTGATVRLATATAAAPARARQRGDSRCVTRSWWSPAPAGSTSSSRTPPR